jgi:hypothetical protein
MSSFEEECGWVLRSIRVYNSYLECPDDTRKYDTLLKNLCHKKYKTFSELLMSLLNKDCKLRNALICADPEMCWAPSAFSREKNVFVLKIIAELVWNDAPESAILNLIPYISNLRRYVGWKSHICADWAYPVIRKNKFDIKAISHFKNPSEEFTRENFIMGIYLNQGFINVDDLFAAGLVTSIDDVWELQEKGYSIREFIYNCGFIGEYDILYSNAKRAKEYKVIHPGSGSIDDIFYDYYICQYSNSRICVNPYTILMSSRIKKIDKFRWLKRLVTSLKIQGKKRCMYQDEVNKWFLTTIRTRPSRAFFAFSRGKFEGPVPIVDIRIDLVMSKIAGFLRLD